MKGFFHEQKVQESNVSTSDIFRPPDSYMRKSLDEKKEIMAKNILDALSASDDSYKSGGKEYLIKLLKYLGIPEGDFNVDSENSGKLSQIRKVVDVIVSTMEQKVANGETMSDIIQAGFTFTPVEELFPSDDPKYLDPKNKKIMEKAVQEKLKKEQQEETKLREKLSENSEGKLSDGPSIDSVFSTITGQGTTAGTTTSEKSGTGEIPESIADILEPKAEPLKEEVVRSKVEKILEDDQKKKEQELLSEAEIEDSEKTEKKKKNNLSLLRSLLLNVLELLIERQKK